MPAPYPQALRVSCWPRCCLGIPRAACLGPPLMTQQPAVGKGELCPRCGSACEVRTWWHEIAHA
eukprot:1161861-Pelagomonas_calceolata.AAC.7